MRIGDFTLAEVLSEIKAAFEFSDDVDDILLRELSNYQKKRTFEKFAYRGKDYRFGNKITGPEHIPCLELIVIREDGKFFILEHQIKILISAEQCELLERIAGYYLVQKHDSCIVVSTSSSPFFLRESRDTTESPIRSYKVLLGKGFIDQTWTCKQTFDELRKYFDVSPNFYNIFLFEREQIMIKNALAHTRAQGNLVAIVLNNVLDQGQLLQYRGLI